MKKFLRTVVCILLVISVLMSFAACGKQETGSNDKNDEWDNLQKNDLAVNNTYEDAFKAWVDYVSCGEWSPEKELKLFGGFAAEEMEILYDILCRSNFADYVRNHVYRNSCYYFYDGLADYGEATCTITNIRDKTPKAIEKRREKLCELLSIEIKEKLAELDAATVAEVFEISTADAENAIKALGTIADLLENAEITEGHELDVLFTFTERNPITQTDRQRERSSTFGVYKINGTWVFCETENIVSWYCMGLVRWISSGGEL